MASVASSFRLLPRSLQVVTCSRKGHRWRVGSELGRMCGKGRWDGQSVEAAAIVVASDQFLLKF